MPNTPKNNGDDNGRADFERTDKGSLSQKEKRKEERHAESLKLQEKFIKVNQRISLATLIYAIAAVAMLLLSFADIFLF